MTDLLSPRRASSLTARLGGLTPARVALARTGASLTTEEVLRFQLAHAEARDAVHVPLDGEALAAAITGLGCDVVRVATPATQRDVYLRRPDLGRRLEPGSAFRGRLSQALEHNVAKGALWRGPAWRPSVERCAGATASTATS